MRRIPTFLMAIILALSVIFMLVALKSLLPKPPRVAAGGALLCENDPNWLSRRNTPLYIVPHAEGRALMLYEMREWLERMEPGGAHGKIQLGYTMGVLPLTLYTKKTGSWEIQTEDFEKDLAWAARQKRPFVVYVLSNHFADTGTPLIEELKHDARNMMTLRTPSAFKEDYFRTKLLPFTMSSDASIPVNHYKNRALAVIAQKLAAFDRAHPGLLIGIEMNGETHYLFPDFFTGTANVQTPQWMDYSDQAVQEFAEFLQQRGVTLPAEKIRDIPLDHYQAGYLPISGWLDDPTGQLNVEIYVDGLKKANAEKPINRLDVFENPDSGVHEPNSGFSYMLDASALAHGRHVVQAVVSYAGKRMEIGRREFTVGRDTPNHAADSSITTASLSGPFKGYLDQPLSGSQVHYEPLVREFLAFRAQQVKQHIQKMATFFHAEGFPAKRLFSYQLTPWLFGGWNEQLFGIGRDFFSMQEVTPGVNLYGGNVANPHVFNYMDNTRGYAIPEMHPQMANAAGIIEKAMRYHYCKGAVFMGPYFVMLKQKKKYNEHARFRLSADNPDWGSADFFRILSEMVKQ
ncbi:MAG: hypothetical protein K2Q12_05485 [Rickettsiales bacterium]|nr:hypothetical protein [Rickettsiales bacterium]